jgi:integrase
MGLGRYPKVSLAAARKKARAYRTLIQDGIDPIDERRIQRVKKRREAKKDIVFKDCAEEYIALRFSGDGFKDPEKAAARMRDVLKRHVYPIIGPLPVKLIDTDLVIEVLKPIWTTKRQTADLVPAWIEDVLRYAKARAHRTGDNPAAFDNVEPNMAKRSKKKVKPYASLRYEDIGEFSVQLGSRPWVSAPALELLILTAARPGEVAGARWSEFDFERKIWTIPAERMETEETHVIPLSDYAIRLLKEIMKFAEGEFVFPGRKAGKHLTVSALEAALRRMGRDFVPHGFRSSFRTWGTECTEYPHWLLEICLAHTVKAAREAGADPALWKAYQRGKALEKRRPIMEQWAEFVVSSKFGSTELLPKSPMQLVARDITPAPAASLTANPTEPIRRVGHGTGRRQEHCQPAAAVADRSYESSVDWSDEWLGVGAEARGTPIGTAEGRRPVCGSAKSWDRCRWAILAA